MEREQGGQPAREWTGEPEAGAVADDELALHEERARMSTVSRERTVGVRKHVTEEPVSREVPRRFEEAEVGHAAVGPDDSGEVEELPDGSISIPILEEELVVTKRTVVKERIIVRKLQRTEQARVETTLRREHAEITGDADVEPPTDYMSDQRAAS